MVNSNNYSCRRKGKPPLVASRSGRLGESYAALLALTTVAITEAVVTAWQGRYCFLIRYPVAATAWTNANGLFVRTHPTHHAMPIRVTIRMRYSLFMRLPPLLFTVDVKQQSEQKSGAVPLVPNSAGGRRRRQGYQEMKRNTPNSKSFPPRLYAEACPLRKQYKRLCQELGRAFFYTAFTEIQSRS